MTFSCPEPFPSTFASLWNCAGEMSTLGASQAPCDEWPPSSKKRATRRVDLDKQETCQRLSFAVDLISGSAVRQGLKSNSLWFPATSRTLRGCVGGRRERGLVMSLTLSFSFRDSEKGKKETTSSPTPALAYFQRLP